MRYMRDTRLFNNKNKVQQAQNGYISSQVPLLKSTVNK